MTNSFTLEVSLDENMKKLNIILVDLNEEAMY